MSEPKIEWRVSVEETGDGWFDRWMSGGGWQWSIYRYIRHADFHTDIDSRSGYAPTKDKADRKVAHARSLIEAVIHTRETEGEPLS